MGQAYYELPQQVTKLLITDMLASNNSTNNDYEIDISFDCYEEAVVPVDEYFASRDSNAW
jgi:hypothetical protein